MTAFILINQSGYCISSKAIRDGAEEVLYGEEFITSRLVIQALEKINTPSKPFVDPAPRENAEAKKIISRSKKDLEEKIDTSLADNMKVIKGRILAFLNLDDSSFDPSPLSFLIEEICSQI